MTQNRESLSSLIAGFFSCYGQNSGFHWTGEVISLRSKGGILKKQDKGWTGAKWAENHNHIRLRYLLCIEDPFEIEHNIARTVVHSGIVAIRDEFRRAIKVLTSISKTDNTWQWRASEALSSESLIEEIPDREDFLRKDTEAHRARAKQRKLDDQAEKASSLQSNSTWGDVPQADRDGTWNESCSASPERQNRDSHHEASCTQLTRGVKLQQGKRRHLRGRLRKVKNESEDESDAEIPSILIPENPPVDVMLQNDVPNVAVAIAEQLAQEAMEKREDAKDYSTQGLNAIPVPEPWNLNTKVGRWLERRDNKIRNNQEFQIRNYEQRKWNDQFPHDPRRSATDPEFGIWLAQEIYPPWPSTAPTVNKTMLQSSQTGATDSAEQGDSHYSPGKAVAATWDPRTQGGRRLIQRDRQIEAGTFVPPTANQDSLFNESFPYDPKRTGDELQLMNELLRQYCRQRHWLLDDSHRRIQEALENFRSSKNESRGEMLTPGHRYDTRDQLPAFKGTSSEAPAAPESTVLQKLEEVSNVQSLMREAGISFSDEKHRRADSGISGVGQSRSNVLIVPQQHSVTQPQVKDNDRILQKTAPDPTSEPATNTYSNTSHPRVPSTLHPQNTETSPQPREENPQIIPIPRRLHHQFDIRQLRDIDTIRRGGNGCVRRSTRSSHVITKDSSPKSLDAWEIGMIEESSECEWGGGGAMGEQVWGGTTSMEDATQSAMDAALQTARKSEMQPRSGQGHAYDTGTSDLGDEHPFNAEDGIGNEVFWMSQEYTVPTPVSQGAHQKYATSDLPLHPTMTNTTSDRQTSSSWSEPVPVPAVVLRPEPLNSDEEAWTWTTDVWTAQKARDRSWDLHGRAADVEGEAW